MAFSECCGSLLIFHLCPCLTVPFPLPCLQAQMFSPLLDPSVAGLATEFLFNLFIYVFIPSILSNTFFHYFYLFLRFLVHVLQHPPCSMQLSVFSSAAGPSCSQHPDTRKALKAGPSLYSLSVLWNHKVGWASKQAFAEAYVAVIRLFRGAAHCFGCFSRSLCPR